MNSQKILFVTQEINPYVPESLMTQIGRAVPLKAIDEGYEIRTFMPKWGNINERRNQLHEVIRLSGLNITVNDVDHPLIIKVASVTGTRMQVYFIDNEDYFAKRLAEEDANGKEYADNVERSVFYARGVLETVKKLRWQPDLIHCQGWISSMLPILLKTVYADEPCFRNTKVVYVCSDNKLTLSSQDPLTDVLDMRQTPDAIPVGYEGSTSPEQMEELALRFCDGVSLCNESPSTTLLHLAQERGIPMLEDKEMSVEKQLDLIVRTFGAGSQGED
ncbi:MAG: glycogen/starch synthase [Prevotellaceae bacterium]|nr:glycogen/starch synthase [Prevotellaceae bacterium]